MKRVNFGKIVSHIDPPLLLSMQKDSFADFLQMNVEPAKRKLQGLEGAFKDVFPLTNSDGSLIMDYISYSFGEPKYSVEESIARDETYSAPLKVQLRLSHKKEDGKIKQISEQEVYFGEIPLMTDTATFVINGAERVVVSQIHRSPGVIFEEDEEKKVTVFGKPLYFARIIPYRGAWIEFEFDQNGILSREELIACGKITEEQTTDEAEKQNLSTCSDGSLTDDINKCPENQTAEGQ